MIIIVFAFATADATCLSCSKLPITMREFVMLVLIHVFKDHCTIFHVLQCKLKKFRYDGTQRDRVSLVGV